MLSPGNGEFEIKISNNFTYSSSNLADLVTCILDHVEEQQSHCEVVIRPDNACEHRHACDSEENVLDNLLAVHLYLTFSNFKL